LNPTTKGFGEGTHNDLAAEKKRSWSGGNRIPSFSEGLQGPILGKEKTQQAKTHKRISQRGGIGGNSRQKWGHLSLGSQKRTYYFQEDELGTKGREEL